MLLLKCWGRALIGMSQVRPLGDGECSGGRGKLYYHGRSQATLGLKWGPLFTKLKREEVVLAEG